MEIVESFKDRSFIKVLGFVVLGNIVTVLWIKRVLLEITRRMLWIFTHKNTLE